MEKINMIDLQKRKLKSCYIAVYVVAKEVKIRTDTCIANKKLYVLLGIDIMGNKQILTMYFDNVYNNVKIVHSPDSIFQNITKFWADHPSRKMKVVAL